MTVDPQAWLERFQAALTARDVDAAVALFGPECFWRDLVAFTWNIATAEGPEAVRARLVEVLDRVDPTGFRVEEGTVPTRRGGVDEAWVEFETSVGRGRGHLRLQDGKAWTLLTTLYELTGHEEPSGTRRPVGAEHGANKDRQTWLERRDAEAGELGYTRQPYVLVIGGGQGGIALGARLRQLDVPTIVVDRHARPGDQWRSRYKSLCLHDPVWYDHLPYLPFPENWPVFAPKDKIGDWLEMYVKVMELNYWSSTTVESASFDEAAGRWDVEVTRDGERLTLHPTELVFATGMSGKARMPEFPGMDRFRGEQQHSSQHPGPEQYRDKKVVVVGSNNSAHDICAALWEHGADVTMVQRSSTLVVRSEAVLQSMAGTYSEAAVAAGMTTARADLVGASVPMALLGRFQKPVYDRIRERDAAFYARLEAAGFELDFGEDDTGMSLKYLRRGSGYYIDVGASELVADGSVALARGQVRELTEDAVVLADGTALPADLVVYATGYEPANGWVADLVDQGTADRLGRVWGLGSGTTGDPGPWEGELRNVWKPTAVPQLWFHGGNLAMSRHFSLYLALQLKARYEGIPTPVAERAPVHHPR
ncbi:NAD(P)/FAD-dependent oxidoreductase [Klenkia taihuensis]|uniref:Putative flavoprotein involved in K+ transport n=1 Tax=Klenkia taihuensis TaxID=1225127 RepID=A0A1I1H2W1_9ACTN|nr:NAD(P)/FAD-dependent oxidoreductase [Klenkia taihuensis]GHE09416.1 FAD-dependent oxidoreductase [Klenkia taihuensis]SFC18479.1 putative flavoprotein involved in K+ transport [Klenkia taihuensis]